ncbi:MAG: hypothetical protein NTW19_19815 [Planctomycetota bacterium]|nr:hypothetical protein [Planctomycetota bacterium]
MSADLTINPDQCTDKLRVDYAHIGLFDAQERRLWIARQAPGLEPLRVSHAKLLRSGSAEASTADKDRFVCYWFHTPNTGRGYVQGYPIEWDEGHLLVRLDPNWNYTTRKFIPSTDTARIERNVEQQYAWAGRIFEAYTSRRPGFALSWHMIGPRPSDSMFYVKRVEATGEE